MTILAVLLGPLIEVLKEEIDLGAFKMLVFERQYLAFFIFCIWTLLTCPNFFGCAGLYEEQIYF